MNPYSVLGVERDADAATIKKAFRQAALASHPDQHPDDPEAGERFKAVARAWAVLGDAERRQVYDTTGRTGHADESTSFWGGVDFERTVDGMEVLFADILADLFKPRGS